MFAILVGIAVFMQADAQLAPTVATAPPTPPSGDNGGGPPVMSTFGPPAGVPTVPTGAVPPPTAG